MGKTDTNVSQTRGREKETSDSILLYHYTTQNTRMRNTL